MLHFRTDLTLIKFQRGKVTPSYRTWRTKTRDDPAFPKRVDSYKRPAWINVQYRLDVHGQTLNCNLFWL